MKDIIKDISELDNMSLSILMDEAVSASPRISFYRIKTKVEGHEQFTSALILCAAKGSSLYDEAATNDKTNRKTVPASEMRMRTIGATIRQTALRMHDIGCLTTEPDLYLLATINPVTIDYLESIMEDTMPTS